MAIGFGSDLACRVVLGWRFHPVPNRVLIKGEKKLRNFHSTTTEDGEKKEQEIASLIRIPDSFQKIVVVKDYIKPWKDDKGIQYIGIEDFLLDENLISK